jgi:hypothetical protein
MGGRGWQRLQGLLVGAMISIPNCKPNPVTTIN